MIESNSIILTDEEHGFQYKLEQDYSGITINWRNNGSYIWDDEKEICVLKSELPHFIKALQSLVSNY